MAAVRIIGGGPAGCAAAIAARQEDCEVSLIEKSRFPRHKVCGEFLSPEIAPLLESLGVWESFQAAGPARIIHLELHFPSAKKRCKLQEAAYGLSRYRFDELLFTRALEMGAVHQTAVPDATDPGPTITAHGRKILSARGGRLFGFKSHFEGPVNDAVELYFFSGIFSGCYVGINPVEVGITNVCGLGPENILRSHAFDFDSVVNSFPPLAERLRPLHRTMRWHTAGPLVFENHLRDASKPLEYPVGDALSFVDPFTGSGLLSAVLTGTLGGVAAARGVGTEVYLSQCRSRLQRPFLCSSLIRKLVRSGWAEHLVGLVPGRVLLHMTRPQCKA